ncbi:hypothetical protein HN51_067533 [Arachis hypogaea]|uniref:DUF1279 domain-containing protein n=1 Tax=Arachis hypogaea TaxID=3818 RepID=A0A444ZQZ5_ARAHY|nr:uncharacterized protein LOC107635213 [Arachis ipaensis]XP_025649716.1 uncharacterized protein LOC112744335 [Arachis hypogaea]QHO08976.1 uncharacterized protein DS421_14g477300 [Arachis hypogaea]RYR16512.1 hypothetical protein Ahy_B04g073550 [Arachis hypogaea]
MAGGRFRELFKKYGKVALGVHCSVSAASISGLYVAIRNNVDVESVLEKFHMGAVSDKEDHNSDNPNLNSSSSVDSVDPVMVNGADDEEKPRSRTAQLAASAGGAFTLALLCNKALFPVRVPITVMLTPPIARFLRSRNIIKSI